MQSYVLYYVFILRSFYLILLQTPTTASQWEVVAQDYHQRWNFPQCLGALDGKHIVMQAPQHSGSFYYNYKGTHSVVLLALVDAQYKFLYVNVGCNGRISDGGVFSNSSLSTALEQNVWNFPSPKPLPGRTKATPYVVVADDAFPLRFNIMKPYPFKSLGGADRVFNYRLSRARRIVENAFGLLANVFRVFRKPMLLGPERTVKIVLASCVLHNFLLGRKSSRNLYAPPGSLDSEDSETHEIHLGSWRNEQSSSGTFTNVAQQGSNFSAAEARQIREEFKEYFMSSDGEVSWQYRYI